MYQTSHLVLLACSGTNYYEKFQKLFHLLLPHDICNQNVRLQAVLWQIFHRSVHDNQA